MTFLVKVVKVSTRDSVFTCSKSCWTSGSSSFAWFQLLLLGLKTTSSFALSQSASVLFGSVPLVRRRQVIWDVKRVDRSTTVGLISGFLQKTTQSLSNCWSLVDLRCFDLNWLLPRWSRKKWILTPRLFGVPHMGCQGVEDKATSVGFLLMVLSRLTCIYPDCSERYHRNNTKILVPLPSQNNWFLRQWCRLSSNRSQIICGRFKKVGVWSSSSVKPILPVWYPLKIVGKNFAEKNIDSIVWSRLTKTWLKDFKIMVTINQGDRVGIWVAKMIFHYNMLEIWLYSDGFL